MRVTVCELPDDARRRMAAWSALVRYLEVAPTDVVVFPEMPFVDWAVFTDLSWRIGRAGAHLIAAPRATGGHRRWIASASLIAIVSGCFVASANRRSRGGFGEADLPEKSPGRLTVRR